MERIYWIEYKSVRILIMDFSKLGPDQRFLDEIAIARELIDKEPPKSILAVLDLTGASFVIEKLYVWEDFVNKNLPFFKQTAIIGMSGFISICVKTISKATGIEFPFFKSKNEALEYLIHLKCDINA